MIKNWKFLAGIMVVVVVITGLAVVPALADRGGDEKLADALGITEDRLQAAQQQAHETAIQQALAQGLITQEQADAMLEREANGFGPMRGGFGMHVGDVFGDGTIDQQALLANALGISVDQLQAALDQARSEIQAEQQQARADRLAQAIANGDITQEQANQMQARDRLRDYFDQETAQNAIRAAYESVIAQAVAEGVITQEQANTILEDGRFGLGGMIGGFGEMQGHFGRHGDFGGMRGEFGEMQGHFGGRGDFGGMRGEFGDECGGPGSMGIE